MNLDSARRVAWIRALEEADPAGARERAAVRGAATRGVADDLGIDPAMPPDGDGWVEPFLEGRADRLRGEAGAGDPGGLGAWTGRVRRVGRAAAVVVPVAAFLLGWSGDRLASGGARAVNVLAFPLIGLFLWNAGVYAVLAVRGIRAAMGGDRGGASGRGDGVVAAMVAGMARRGMGGVRDGGRGADPGESRASEAVRERFFVHWSPLELPVWVARGRAVLHAAAAAAVGGMIAAMYARGIAHQYVAVWESTFLGREAVATLLHLLLGPAAAAGGIPVPELAAESAPMDAAPWIHLYALSAAGFVLVPRLLLALAAWRRGRRLERAVPLAAVAGGWGSHARQLLRGTRGRGTVVDVLPLAVTPETPVRDAVRRFAADRWGGSAVVEFHDPVAYGEEEAWAESGDSETGDLVLLVPMTATPEAEVHGRLAARLAGEGAGGAGEGAVRGVVAVLDGTRFADRFGGLAEYARRRDQRGEAWARVLAPAGVDVFRLEAGAVPEWSRVGAPRPADSANDD